MSKRANAACCKNNAHVYYFAVVEFVVVAVVVAVVVDEVQLVVAFCSLISHKRSSNHADIF